MSTLAPARPTIDSPDADISARTFWAQDFETRDRIFARFRETCPVSWHRPYESELLPPDADTPGFWSIWNFEDIRAVSRNAKLFCSGQGMLMEDFPEVVATMSQSFLAMDDPEHAQLRAIVSQAFTPRRMRTIEGWIRENVNVLVDEMAHLGEGDFCELFAKQVPGRIFADFFGLPEGETRENVMDAAEKMLAWDDPEAAQGRDALETYGEEAQRLLDICFDLIDERRAAPGEDLLSWLVEAEFEGRKLEDWEIGSFFTLLAAAGNDTTRHSTAHALHLLTAHPEQRALLLEDLDGRLDGAVEEILRFASPVMQFRRTATADTELRGVPIAAGEKVVMWYCSGNRDESVFPAAGRFEIQRDSAVPHLGFGGGGPHYCMGAALGRLMLKHGLHELYTRMPDIESGTPELQVNNFIHGVSALPRALDAGLTGRVPGHHEEEPMGYFADADDVYRYLGGVFRLAAETEVGPKLATADIDLQVYYSDPDTRVLITMHGDNIEVFDDTENEDADVKLFMPADIGDKYWRGEYNLAVGLAKGQVKAKGPVNKILKLVPLTRPVFPMYREMVAEKDAAAA